MAGGTFTPPDSIRLFHSVEMGDSLDCNHLATGYVAVRGAGRLRDRGSHQNHPDCRTCSETGANRLMLVEELVNRPTHGKDAHICRQAQTRSLTFGTVQPSVRELKPKGKAISDMPLRSGRLEKRAQLAVPIRVSSLMEPDSERSTTENVCPSGLRIMTRKPRKLNERLFIQSLDGELRTMARVVYCQRLSDGRFGVGLEFQEVANWPKRSFAGVD